MVKTMAKLRMAHTSTHGARKPPGPIFALGLGWIGLGWSLTKDSHGMNKLTSYGCDKIKLRLPGAVLVYFILPGVICGYPIPTIG